MRVISKRAIREFVKIHPDAVAPLEHCYRVAQRATWGNLAEARQHFPHADPVGRFTVFDIGGNKYRLVTTIKYQWQVVYIRAILTHGDYDQGGWTA